jgi:hypothetical protein
MGKSLSKRASSLWWYGNCLYDDSKFIRYLLKHHELNSWSLLLPDGTETPRGTKAECMEVAIDLASGMRPSSTRVHPGE